MFTGMFLSASLCGPLIAKVALFRF